MHTKEELNALKEEVETVSKQLHELTKEDLAQVTGGDVIPGKNGCNPVNKQSLFNALFV